jgi:tetratricopeptide (TPR) repeat protein
MPSEELDALALRDQVRECLEIIEKYKAEGRTPPTLTQLLFERGYIDKNAYRQTLKITAVESEIEPGHAPSQDLGKFILVELLGKGGMGEVWKAYEKDLSRHVAIKFIYTHDPEDEKRFIREAQVVAKLDHPNITPVYEYGVINGHQYLVMPLIKGRTLDVVGADLRMKLSAIRDIALALDYAHRQGVIHRDVKPQNIMVEGSRAYLMDFGLARPTKVEQSISQSGVLLGTPLYMSPEQARGETRLLGPRSDIYSLGATLYSVLVGRPAFDSIAGADVMATLRRVTEDEPRPPRLLKPDIPWEVETITLKAMEKEAWRRYSSGKEMADDIGRYLDGEPILARRASIFYRAGKWIRKHKWIAASIFLAVGLGVYALALTVRAAAAEDRRRASEVFEQAARELSLMRLQTYRPGWKLTHEEFEEGKKLIQRCRDQMNRTGDDEQAWWVIGSAYGLLGDWPEAIKAFDAALRIRPDHASSLLSKARLIFERAIWQAFTAPPSQSSQKSFDAVAEEALGLLDRAVREGRLKEIELDICRGFMMFLRKENPAEYCEGMLKKWKGKDFAEEFHFARALWYLYMGRQKREPFLSESAIGDIDEAVKLRPGYAVAYVVRGAAKFDVGEHTDSYWNYSQALHINPRYSDVFVLRAEVLMALGKFKEAIQDMTQAIQIRPDVALWYGYRANAYRRDRDFSSALKDIDTGLALDPRLPELYHFRGEIREDIKDLSGALEDYSRSIELYPTQFWSLGRRGLLRKSADDLKAALKHAPSYWTNRPQLEEALKNLR